MSDTHRPHAVILGAGRPVRGQQPSALFGIAGHGRVLDWQIRALGDSCEQVVFVGGYRLPEIVALYPTLHAVINPDWAGTGVVGSLLRAELQTGPACVASYADILYRHELVRQVCAHPAEVVIAVDSRWRQRYDSRSAADLASAEVLMLEGGLLRSAHGRRAADRPGQADAEFVGLAMLGPRALALLRSWAVRPEVAGWDFPQLLNAFVAQGLQVAAIDCLGDWAELNAPQDMARFVLGTKAQTLQRLRPMVRHSHIGEQVMFTVGEWRTRAHECLAKVHRGLGSGRLIVRSSALAEDGFNASNAGHFASVLDVDGGDARALGGSIESVVASYADASQDHQVLVQRMVAGIAFSGVVMTRTLSHGAPYRVVNYDVSGASDTVTSGAGETLKTLFVHRAAAGLPQDAPPAMPALLRAVGEIEDLVGHDSLDVEFIVTHAGDVHVLQIRPIAVDHGHWRGSDELVLQALAAARADFHRLQAPGPFVRGRKTVFSVMTDWNPAEMIGTRPRQLACSLYAALITDEVWARQRREYGYRAVSPQPLMHVFAGHPYIDVRASLNSFIPVDLGDELAERLVDHGIELLVAQPDLHDKLEFDIAITCLAFDFEQRARRLRESGFSGHEVERLRATLAHLTQRAWERVDADAQAVEALARRQLVLGDSGQAPLLRALALLEDCRSFGTLAFAHMARAGFVATTLLNSAVAVGLVSDEERAAYLQSVVTVAAHYQADWERFQGGEMGLGEFLARYGHLRPGTYEITTPSYAEDLQRYLGATTGAQVVHQRVEQGQVWSAQTRARFESGLKRLGLEAGFDQVDHFMRQAIAGREQSKFVFTRGLSRALDLIVEFGREAGLSRDELSHLSLADLQAAQSGCLGSDIAASLRVRAEEGALAHELALGIELPPLLVKEEDFSSFFYPDAAPNFVGSRGVTAGLVCVDRVTVASQDLTGKIVLIMQADPGYDWLFGHGIAGLVTAYGGANSHMAVRAAEFGLPAAIGVGEKRYHRLAACRRLVLDCRLRTITELH